jgi:hypothetical protein
MARAAIQCGDILPEANCSLWLIGDPGVVEGALRDHLAKAHGREFGDLGQRLRDASRNAVQVGRTSAYVGDDFDLDEANGKITIGGPTVVITELAADQGHTTLSCDCGNSTQGTCNLKTTASGTATCQNGTCTDCGWSTSGTGFSDIKFQTAEPV